MPAKRWPNHAPLSAATIAQKTPAPATAPQPSATPSDAGHGDDQCSVPATDPAACRPGARETAPNQYLPTPAQDDRCNRPVPVCKSATPTSPAANPASRMPHSSGAWRHALRRSWRCAKQTSAQLRIPAARINPDGEKCLCKFHITHFRQQLFAVIEAATDAGQVDTCELITFFDIGESGIHLGFPTLQLLLAVTIAKQTAYFIDTGTCDARAADAALIRQLQRKWLPRIEGRACTP